MKPNWKYIGLFIVLSIGISAPIHLGYLDQVYVTISKQWIVSEWVYLLAGLGPFVAAVVVLFLQKNISNRITVFGDAKGKNILITLLPIAAFSIVGFENSYGFNAHYFGFIYALINVIYAFLEEFGWRKYLQNALEGINNNWKYIIVGIIWWVWHLRFETQFDLFIFPIICIGGGYLLGKLTDETKSILPVVTLHTLIILLSNSGTPTRSKIIGVGVTILGWLIIEWVWKKRAQRIIPITDSKSSKK